jgi:hypothetical protein
MERGLLYERDCMTRARKDDHSILSSQSTSTVGRHVATTEATEPDLHVVILSGGTGRTAETVLRAALAQFGKIHVTWQSFTGVRSVRQAKAAVRQAASEAAILFHSLVDPKIRHAAMVEVERCGVVAVDVLGPALSALADKLGRSPRGKAGLAYAWNKEQYQRIEAVDFTLAHDDGQGLSDLDRADVVLVGVSRVSKSVTCFYLAYRGIRAANVPLVPGTALPEELLKLPKHKVIGLTMNPGRLQAIRAARAVRGLAGANPSYTDKRAIARELQEARRIMEEHGWRCLDVSYMAVEEVALEIRTLLGL